MSDTTAAAPANPAKKVHLLVSVGTDDERTMTEFEDALREALSDEAKNITVLMSKYLVNGEELLAHEYEASLEASLEQEEVEDDSADE